MQAPWISTAFEIALLPVAFLFIHTFVGGLKKWKSHRWTGLAAVVFDLLLSATYMIYRSLGGLSDGQTLHPQGLLLVYFIVHGSISVVVMGIEIWTLIAAMLFGLRGQMPRHHRVLGRWLFGLWLAAFLTGESAYLFLYVFH